MKGGIYLVIFLFCGVTILSLSFKPATSPLEQVFQAQVQQVLSELEKFDRDAAQGVDTNVLRTDFARCRLAYKRASVLVDYFFPILRRSINGPDLKFAEDDNPDQIHDPHGFQVIERLVYEKMDSGSVNGLKNEIALLTGTFNSISGQREVAYKLRDELVYDAMKSALIRLTSLGITGFDSPIAQLSLPESGAVLEGMKDIILAMKIDGLNTLIEASQNDLKTAGNFNSFDRLSFIKKRLDPLYSKCTSIARSSDKLLPEERRPLNQLASSMFSDSLFDINFFSPNRRYQLNELRISLGRSLFYDSIFSRTSKRSCASCHDPSKAFTDGMRVPVAVNPSTVLKRNTPTLTAAALQTKFFWDSRASTLENQMNSVVHNIDEMGGSLKQTIERIRENEYYSEQFAKAYAGDKPPVTEYNIANAISSYVRSLTSLNTRFDRYMRGQATLTAREKKGFNLFAGKAKCATCHFIPLFNGLVPPFFTETESEVLGVPATPASNSIDADNGKFEFTRSEIHRHAFKTPTLRNVTKTAPYMHNGVFGSLEQVMEFYNKGGGTGAGLQVENQTLPADPLGLSKREIADVIAFLRTLQ